MTWLTTKAGDQGQTSLYDGTKVSKNSLLVELYGTVDEAQAFIGFARSQTTAPEIHEKLQTIERRMYDLMAVMAHAQTPTPPVTELEEYIHEAQQVVGEKFQFQLPGESAQEAAFHMARTVVRRAERLALCAIEQDLIPHEALIYLNRLSDCLFALMLQTRKSKD